MVSAALKRLIVFGTLILSGSLWLPVGVGVSAPAFGEGLASVASESAQSMRIVINIPSRTLWLYQGDQIVRRYPVGVGRLGFSTPVGQFQVIRKVRDPEWENPYLPKGKMVIPAGSQNPLGTRWIGFKQDKRGEYGIHGTDNPASVGKLSSHGCVRMRIPDAEALFEQVEVGTPVEVVYDTAIIDREGDAVRLAVYPDYFKRGMPTAATILQLIRTHYPTATVDVKKVQQLLKTPLQQPREIGVIGQAAPVSAESVPLREASFNK